VLQQAAAGSLRVVAAGAPSPASARSLQGALATVLNATGDDLVVVDGPGLLESANALPAAGVAGSTLLVVDASDQRASDDLDAAVTQLRDAGTDILGVVLNRAAVQ
jgi:Mrp family chromosome partitioning ATPase